MHRDLREDLLLQGVGRESEMTFLLQPDTKRAVVLPPAVAEAVRLFQESMKSGTVILRFKEGRLMQVDKTEIAKV